MYVGIIFCAVEWAGAVPTYENGELVRVEYVTNFMFTYQPPLSIALTELWQWYVYVAVIAVLAVVLIGCCYLPFWRRERQAKKIA